MYLAESPQIITLDAFFNKYAPIVKQKFKYLLDGNSYDITRYGVPYECKMLSGPFEQFLNKYSTDIHLRKLLVGNLDELKAIIQEIIAFAPDFEKPLTKDKHKNELKKKSKPYIIEDINALFNQIFVKEIYEDIKVFNKNELIEWKGLEICPYCGVKTIIPYDGPDNNTEKPQIDHYLPKSKFPFFAISYFNLFPVCTECNNFHNKGEHNPLTVDYREERLMHPYEFDRNALSFEGKYTGAGDMNVNNFSVDVSYGDNRHREGYNDVIAVENKYKTFRKDIKNLYNKISKQVAEKQVFQEYYGANLGDLSLNSNNFMLSVLGFEDTLDDARTTEKHKFQIDLFNSFITKLRKP